MLLIENDHSVEIGIASMDLGAMDELSGSRTSFILRGGGGVFGFVKGGNEDVSSGQLSMLSVRCKCSVLRPQTRADYSTSVGCF